jgi:hypothetical protein
MTGTTGRQVAGGPAVGAAFVVPGVQSFLDALAAEGGRRS